MKVLFTGKGGITGTWRMRAIEMASTHTNWKAVPMATKQDFIGIDAVVLIKRINPTLLEPIKQWGGPFFYDALDFWRQSIEDTTIFSVKDIHKTFNKYFNRCSPFVILCTNKIMAKDIASMGYKTEVHYHHYDSKLIPSKNRLSNSILYWGLSRYLEEWYDIMKKVCKKLDKVFLVHSGKQSIIGSSAYNAEAMFAVRGGKYNTWLAKRWKSGIKGITAERLGIPFIAMPEQSYIEQAPKNLFPFADKHELENAIITAFKEKDTDRIKKSSTEFSLKNCANQLEKTIEEAISYV